MFRGSDHSFIKGGPSSLCLNTTNNYEVIHTPQDQLQIDGIRTKDTEVLHVT